MNFKSIVGLGLLPLVIMSAPGAGATSSCQDVDFNGDGAIDISDIETFKQLIGKSLEDEGYLEIADLDGSGVITPIDFGIFLSCR